MNTKDKIELELFECSVKVVNLLITKYEKNYLDRSLFTEHTKTKIAYLENNLNRIADIELKNEAISAINKVQMLLKEQ